MKIAIFCGSKMPEEDIYKDKAKELAQVFINNNYEMVYGGASIGIMGLIADEMLKENKTVIGVMPEILSSKEIMHTGLTQTIKTNDMHERKQTMMDLSDAFIAFPGGCGTMEEIFEVITWNQIGIHDKRYGFININGFYDGIKTYLDTATETGFISKDMRERILIEEDISVFMNKLTR